MEKKEQMSKASCGHFTEKRDCNGVTIYIGGEPAIREIKACTQNMKIRCHSCEHCRLMDIEKAADDEKYCCTENITDEGYCYEIPDFRTTRCKNWRPKRAWVEALNKDHGNDELKIITREEIEAQIAAQKEEKAKEKSIKQLLSEYCEAKANGNDEKCAQLIEELRQLSPAVASWEEQS